MGNVIGLKHRQQSFTAMSYRIRNWSEYNAALRQRGNLTFWINEAVPEQWVIPNVSGKSGASDFYSDLAISTMATVKAVYQLAGRQCQGFLESIFEMMEIDLTLPDHSTLSRRLGKLSVKLPVLPKSSVRHVVVDSTGVKVYGEGKWKTRQHSISQWRTWRELHLGVDEKTREILSAVVSANDVNDAEVLGDLLDGVNSKIEQVSADGAYDQRKCYNAMRERNAKAAIPPHKGTKIWQHGNAKAERHNRDENLRRIRKVGRKAGNERVTTIVVPSQRPLCFAAKPYW